MTEHWDKIITAVKNPIGYASLSLLVIMSIFIVLIYRIYSDYLLIALAIVICIYTIAILLLLIKYLPKPTIIDDTCQDIKQYPNIQGTFHDMSQIIKKSILSSNNTQIDVIGLSLYHMWEFLKIFLLDRSTERLSINFLFVNSSSPIIKNLQNNWAQLSDTFHDSICDFISRHGGDLEHRTITIKLIRYSHVPMIHGILINGEHLFISYTYWDSKDTLEGASNFYIYYNTNSSIGRDYIKMFRNWVEHIQGDRCDALCMRSIDVPIHERPVEDEGTPVAPSADSPSIVHEEMTREDRSLPTIISQEVSEEIDEDKGYLDFAIEFYQSMENAIKCMKRITDATEAIGNYVTERTPELIKITSRNDPGSMKRMHQMASEFADGLEAYSNIIDDEHPALYQSWKSFYDNVSGLIDNVEITSPADEEAVEGFISQLTDLNIAINGALAGVGAFRESLNNTKGISRELTIASNKIIDSIDKIISDLKFAESSIKKLIHKLMQKK